MAFMVVLLFGYFAASRSVLGGGNNNNLPREDLNLREERRNVSRGDNIPSGGREAASALSFTKDRNSNSPTPGGSNPQAPARTTTMRKQKSTENKDDHAFLQGFSKLLNDIGMCNPSHSIAVGGLNRGQGASVLLGSCRDIRLYGFEISPTELAAARESLAKYPNVVYNRMGMGDVNDVVHFTDNGSKGGIYGAGKSTVQVVPLAEYFAKLSENLSYLLIDVEGYESIVLMGMGLQHERNRKRFPMFQYELGGTWAERDNRHPKGSMNQYEIASFLINRGYKLFMMGDSALYPVMSAEFFMEGDRNEGKGSFVQGNALAVHPEFVDPRILDWIRTMTQ